MLAEKYQQIMPSGSKENTRLAQKWLRHWLFLKAYCTGILACSLGLPNLDKGRLSPLCMNKIQDLFYREDISRAVPGKTVSAAFKQHKAKYLLNITVEDAYKILRDENPAFPYNIQEILSTKCEDPKVQ